MLYYQKLFISLWYIKVTMVNVEREKVVKIKTDTLERINKMFNDLLPSNSHLAQKLAKRRATWDDKINALLDEVDTKKRGGGR